MSTRVERITALLRNHQPWSTWDIHDRFWCQECQQSYPNDDFAVHVAEQVVLALQDDLAAEFRRGYRHSAAGNSWHRP